jgi:hypothetical protein
LFELRIVTENHYSIDKSILSTKEISLGTDHLT